MSDNYYQIIENGITFNIEDLYFTRSKNGARRWLLNGVLHRENGPAVEYSNGEKFWWFNNKNIKVKTQEEFEQMIKLKSFW